MNRILLAASLLCLTALPAPAESMTKTYSYFSVGGTTLDELEAQLNERGPQVKSTGRRHPGATQMQFNTRLGFTEKNSYCRITEATVTVKAKVILPRWRQRGKADQDVRLIWDTLSDDIKRHEEQHVMIAQQPRARARKEARQAWPAEDPALSPPRRRKRPQTGFSTSTTGLRRSSTGSKAPISRSRMLKLLRQRIKLIEAGEIAG